MRSSQTLCFVGFFFLRLAKFQMAEESFLHYFA